MYPYCSSNNLNVSDVSKAENISTNTAHGTDGSDQVPCKYSCESKNKDLDYYASVLPEGGSCYDRLDFDTVSTHEKLYQDNNCEEKLVPLSVFELNEVCGSNILETTICSGSEQLTTPSALKRPFVKYEPELELSNKKRIPLVTVTEPTIDIIGNIKQSSLQYSTNKQLKNCKKLEGYVTPKELRLRSYHRNNMCHAEFNASIYKDAMKKIDIDSKGLLNDIVLEEVRNTIKNRDPMKLRIDLSATYSNVRRYILEIFSPCINDIIHTSDILITPGMSISDLMFSCTTNDVFFDKLRENCEKILKNEREISNSSLSRLFQSYINFCSDNKKGRISSQKNKFLPILRDLIIGTISDLPNRIRSEIKKFDPSEIINSLFLDSHGVFISKSLIRNLVSFFNSSKDEFVLNVDGDNNLNLLNKLLGRIGNLVRTFCIFHEEVLLPNEPMVEWISKYLLSDMYGISASFHKKLKLTTVDIPESQDDVSFEPEHKKHVSPINTVEEKFGLSEVDTIVYNVINTKIDIGYNSDQDEIKLLKKDETKLEEHTKSIRFNLRPYNRSNLNSAEFTSNIYEDAIKKIDVDSNALFKDVVLEEIKSSIVGKGFMKSSINLSLTYSNIIKYILDKISPYISYIITTSDVIINTNMSVSDIKYSCISNEIFFKELSYNCIKIADEIKLIPDNTFSNIIQSHVSFGSDGRFNIRHKKNKFCSKIKLLIIDTINNLPSNIINEIKKFKPHEIVKGTFSCIHGVSISKNLMRNLNLFFNYSKISNDRLSLDLLKNLFIKVYNQVKTSFIFHEGNIFFPDEPTAETLSRYLLSDMYGIPAKFHKKLKISPESSEKTHEFIDSINLEKDNMVNEHMNIESKLLKKSILAPQKKSKWEPALITSLNIYELALSMIKIDKGDFESSFIDKVRHTFLIKEHLSKKGEINIDFSITYARVKNYILETFYPFLKKIEEETKIKINIYPSITLDELQYSYISNEKFFSKLREFCNKVTKNIENCATNRIIDLMQCVLRLNDGFKKKIVLKKRRRVAFHKDMVKLLTRNISIVPEVIISSIKSLPRPKIVEEYLSPFHGIYIDNSSLLKLKSAFDFTQKKIICDPVLAGLVDRISLNIIDKFGDGKNACISLYLYKIINSYTVCGELSTYNYIRKLVRDELPIIKDKTLNDPIMIMHNDKIEAANQRMISEIFDKIESDLIGISIKSYRELCIKTYKSKLNTVILKKLFLL